MRVDYQKTGGLTLNASGRPVVQLVTLEDFTARKDPGILRIILDTGAYVTTLNNSTAEENNYPISEKEHMALFGFNDKGIIRRELARRGVKDIEGELSARTSKDLKNYLVSKGITDVGLMYDLRIIPIVVIAGFEIRDVVVATPTEGDTKIDEVLGMNVLGRFHIGLNFEGGVIYLSENKAPQPVYDTRYMCGEVTLAQSSPWGAAHRGGV
jgi:hypothetical protein